MFNQMKLFQSGVITCGATKIHGKPFAEMVSTLTEEQIRKVLGDKGCALRTVDKGISRGPNLCPLDKRITDRRARIRTGIQSV